MAEDKTLRMHWNQILARDGLAEIEFNAGVVSSSAASHKARTHSETTHFREQAELESVQAILAEYRIPEKHRNVLYAHMNGDGVRDIGRRGLMSKDSAHRILLRYTGNHDVATMAEISEINLKLAFDARRTKAAKGTSPNRRPLTASEAVAAYFELAAGFAETHPFKWARDREIWEMHVTGMTQRAISRSTGESKSTVRNAIERVRGRFKQWLKSRQPKYESDQAHISAMFEKLTNHERT